MAALSGAAMVLIVYYQSGILFPVLASFTILPLVPGGLGPMLLAGWGAATLTLLDAEYTQAIMRSADAYRLVAYYVLTSVCAVYGGRLRTRKLRTLERESRLAGALARVQELHAATQEFQAQQRAERDLLEGILATSIAGVIVVDVLGAIIFANARAVEVLGLRVSEAPGRRFDAAEWHHTDLDGGPFPDDHQPFAQVLRSGEPVCDLRHGIEWPDGRRKLLSVNGAPLIEARGNIEAVVFGVTDITDVIAAERELRARDERLDQITSVMPGIVSQYSRTADGEESFPYISEVAGESVGADLSSIMRSPAVALSRVHPDDILSMLASIDRSQRDLTKWAHDFRFS
ncbi:PAS domain-containing protein, partial [Gemmatimonas sp.]|uniref:PAS domain-containing protein n=1 Tax=Gemmatimonas sp. TaxID=1962908 RepID=UPI0035639EFF